MHLDNFLVVMFPVIRRTRSMNMVTLMNQYSSVSIVSHYKLVEGQG